MRGLKQITARRQSWRSIGRCERGATAIEYALILSLVFLAIIGAVANVA
ncbi:MAG: Flp family type IVb pilin, partial [Sphingobium sp.]